MSPLAGVRGLLLDLDGVLVLKNRPIPGAADALRRLDTAGVPYLVITNTSLVSRPTLSRQLASVGFDLAPEAIVSAASATAEYVRRNFAGAPLYLLASPDARTEFDGLRLLTHDEAAAPGAEAAAVVIGDAADEFTPRNMLSAFRLLRRGAEFLAMHKNRWWLTPEGETLDAGGYVVALEYAAERSALVVGKPNERVFLEGVRQVAARVPADLRAFDVAMVGDDMWNDVEGARAAGLRGVFVRSGKHGDAELAAAARAGWQPEFVAKSIVEVVDAVLRSERAGSRQPSA